MSDNNVRFLKRPTVLPIQGHGLSERQLSARDVFGIWVRSGAIRRCEPPPCVIRYGDLYGLLALVAIVGFCFGYLCGVSWRAPW